MSQEPIFLNHSTEPFARAGSMETALHRDPGKRGGQQDPDRKAVKIALLVAGLLLLPVLFWVLTADEPLDEPANPLEPRPSASASSAG